MKPQDILQKSIDKEKGQGRSVESHQAFNAEVVWKKQVKEGVKKVDDLASLPLSAEELNDAGLVSQHHKVRIPKG